MDRILIILKKENGPRASSAPALGLNTIIFKHVYWYMQQTQVSVYRTIGPLVCVCTAQFVSNLVGNHIVYFLLTQNISVLFVGAGPSSAFEKWSGHERSKCRRAREGVFPPLVRGVGGISPEKILYFRTSVETILMHFETI